MLRKKALSVEGETPQERAKPCVVLSVAGFDPSSGAGITADLQTFAAHGVFGTAAITALTVQSTRGVFNVQPVDPDLLGQTLEHLRGDLPPRGIKLGMLATPALVAVIVNFLRAFGEAKPPVVLDPVLRSSSGRELFPTASLEQLHDDLLPLVDWITPNWAELALLSGSTVTDLHSAEAAMIRLGERHSRLRIVATGGEARPPIDLMLADRCVQRFEGVHVETQSTHGTGCAFSSALLAHLVHGATASQAVVQSKLFVEGALRHAPGLGNGRGPMHLLWPLSGC